MTKIHLVLLYLVVFMLHFHWTWKDPNYPADDAGDYAQLAQEIYLVGEKVGVSEAFKFAYYHRHWKPVLGQELLAPFIFWSDGDVRSAFKAYALVFSLVFVFGLYFLVVVVTGDRTVALLATLLLNTSPWMLFNHHTFGAELPWLGFLVWSGYFFFRRKLYAASILIALGLMCRPVETAVCVLPVFVGYLLYSLRPQHRAVLVSSLVVLLEATVLLLISLWPFSGTTDLNILGEHRLHRQFIIMVLWTVYIGIKLAILWRKADRHVFHVQTTWTLLMTLVFFWYLPSFRALWSWVSQTSSGVMVQESYGYRLVGENFFKLFFAGSGLLIFVPLALTMARPRGFMAWLRRNQGFAIFSLWGGFALALVGMFTDSRDFRYYQASWVILFLFGVAALVGTLSSPKGRWVSCAVVAVLVAAQAYGTLPRHFSTEVGSWHSWPGHDLVAKLSGDPAVPRVRQPDTDFERFFDELAALNIANNSEFFFIDGQNQRGLRGLTNPWKYTLRARENGHLWNFRTYIRRRDGRTEVEDLLNHAKSMADVLIVGPPNPSTASAPQENAMADVLFKCVRTDCGSYGLVPIRRIGIESDFIVFKVIKELPQPSELLDCYRGLRYSLR